MSKRKAFHDRVLQASSTEELMQVYDDWADEYDRDLINEMDYVAPRIASNLLTKHVGRADARVLDAGCGTGLVGEYLRHQGYENIDGLDYSEAMLHKARQKQIYNDLLQADLTASLDISSHCYEAVICVGTFTCGHVGPEALHELIRVVKPGGYICFTVREEAWEEQEYQTTVKSIEKNDAWQLVEENTADYIQEDGSKCKVCLYQVTS